MDIVLLSEINKKDNHHAKQVFARNGFCSYGEKKEVKNAIS